MVSWALLRRVGVGVLVTVAAGVLTILAMASLGLFAIVIVGPPLPVIAFLATLVHCPILGGVTAAGLEASSRRESVLAGALAGGLGVLVIGVSLLLLALGTSSAQHGGVELSMVVLALAGLGGVIGVLLGGLFGAVGGTLVAIGR